MGASAQDTRTQVSGWREELDCAAGSAGTSCRVRSALSEIGFLEESLSRLTAVLVSVTSKQNQQIQLSFCKNGCLPVVDRESSLVVRLVSKDTFTLLGLS